jgi:hypothetical protein
MLRTLLAITVAALALAGVESAGAAPTGLSTMQSCTGSTAQVTFFWRDVSPGAQQVRIDVTTNDHWRAGTYLSSPAIAATATAYTWPGIKPNQQHFYRVSEQLAGGSWASSITSSFTAVCSSSASSAATPEEQSYRNRATAQLYALAVRLDQRADGLANPSLLSVANDFVAALNGLEPVPPRFSDVHYQLRDAMSELRGCLSSPSCSSNERLILTDDVIDALDDYELVVGIDLPS